MGSNPEEETKTEEEEEDKSSSTSSSGEEKTEEAKEQTDEENPSANQQPVPISDTKQPAVVPPPLSTTPTPTAGGIDAHPYARGSVIEVLHGVQEDNEDHWLSSSSSSSEDEEEDTEESSSNTDSADDTKKHHHHHGTSVRLCDVIDRVGDAKTGKWRYYVHYRDFNRRMDEWIGMERIVAPPSVGNAKARTLKKQEERQKRKQARLEERNAELATSAAAMNAPRASRRRSTVTIVPPTGSAAENGGPSTSTTPTPMAQGNAAATTTATTTTTSTATTTTESSTDAGAASSDGAKAATPRMTRRRKAENESDTTKSAAATPTTTSNGTAAVPSPSDAPTPPAGAAAAAAAPSKDAEKNKEVLTIATAAAEQTVVGEHVVATVPAQEMDEHEGLDEASLREHEEVTKVKNVSFLELGPYRMETWYFSPLPKELLSEKGFIEILYACEFSLNLFSRKSELLRYQARELPKNQRHPPGNEIYRSGNLSMFEVDGFEERIYCQNLCYIAKLFLDHKTLYFDVDPFLFYVLCEVDNRGYHPVGYFSKEKYSDVGYNLACILTFPSQQRKGYGRFLIAFSYELSKKEEKVGSPEKPMSDLGQQAYKPYWMSTIVDFLYNHSEGVNTMSIMEISKKTSIMAEDIVFTLNQLGILKIINGVYFIAAEQSLLERLVSKHPVKDPKVDASKLHWTPFVTDVKRDKFSIHSKKPSVEGDEARGTGGF